MVKASKMFVGYHDFRTFMNKHVNSSEKITRKHIDDVIISRRQLPGYSSYSWPSVLNGEDGQYIAIDIYIKGSSFLYRQVRLFAPDFRNKIENVLHRQTRLVFYCITRHL